MNIHRYFSMLNHSLLAVAAVLCAVTQVEAQNLIPNPGFEDVMAPAERQWVQPQGPFYHYERREGRGEEGARTGKYVNGLCMYNHEPNEYLHIKLTEQLVKGERYVFTVYARLYRNKNTRAHLQQYIGVYFGKRRLDTQLPGDLPWRPQLALGLPDGDRYSWFELRDTLTAEGGEEFLTMGYFPATQRQEFDERRKDAFMMEVERMYQVSQAPPAAPTKPNCMYLPPSRQKQCLKEREQERKAELKAAKKAGAGKGVSAQPPPKPAVRQPVVVPQASAAPDDLFTVRYYFDDFCLAPIVAGEARCETEPQQSLAESLKTGSTLALPNVFFDLDKDVLLPESVVQLEALRLALEEYPALAIEIRGHTDNQGTTAHNLDLSRRRAGAVVQWLVTQGVASDRLTSKGFGATKPIDTNDTEAGQARNRRVECFVVRGL